MTSHTHTIERLNRSPSEADLRDLAGVLKDAVDSNAAVSFMAPVTIDRAIDWWRKTITEAAERSVFLVARDAEGIVGTVQLHPAWAPNQPHRGDIAKLIVHRRARRTGLGRRLMEAIEGEARRGEYELLVLDTRQGDAAEQLYRAAGWTEVGVIPRYALDPDGKQAHGTVIFYKELTPPKGRP